MNDNIQATRQYPPGQHPSLQPPLNTDSPLYRVRKNLFGSIQDTILTLVSLYVIWLIVPSFIEWAFLDADFFAEDRFGCTSDGACWGLITSRWDQFIYGYFPIEDRWRVSLCFALLSLAIAPVLYDNMPYRRQFLIFTLCFPVIAYWLLIGGFLGLEAVETSRFGGLMLTLVLGITGITFSLPIGILLALGRRSEMAGVRAISIVFIEFVRGVPLITLLFMASVMLPLFLPPGVNFDTLLRVLIMVTLFASAYMAEVIRGGLQAIPTGQIEAAQALGLSNSQNLRLIVLPQALKISIPGIVNTFIGLYKDTTLVLIIGLLDLLGVGKANLADAKWLGLSTEVYVFVAVLFFIACFGMSRYSIYLENKLNTGNKK
jgi:general L-amino acid transport system permease protein